MHGMNNNISGINRANTRMSLDDSVADLIRPQNSVDRSSDTASLATEVVSD